VVNNHVNDPTIARFGRTGTGVGLVLKLNSWLTFPSSPGGFPRGRPALNLF
jgi:hypothetical protein